MNTLPVRAEALVIGGGVIGTSIAAHLAETGVDTVLLERGSLGSGASGATAHVVRTYFPGDARTGALAVRSVAAYHSFAERTGTPLGLRRVGFMVLFTDEAQVAEFRRDQAAQRAAGVDVELVTPADAARLNPLLDARQVVAAAWAPEAYSCDPVAVVRGYAAAAADAGAVLLPDSPVIAIDPDGRVHTPAGSIRADTVICAAGPWAGEVGALAGVDLPVRPEPTELLLTDPLTEPLPGAPGVPSTTLPMTLHPSKLRIRAWHDRVLVGMGRPGPDESREDWLQRVSRQLGTVYPALAGTRLHRGWGGSIDLGPDGTALIGRDPARPFLYAAGFSGQGVCQAPAAGELVRDLYLGK
ncbi:NAD(P)/FAD-dependent oxidoreductase [Streptomyces sp. NPDC090025]|uniref:NAD(P)/FAD-dependent oxidoreductase n=1 Tax=Streptomyces sp. NPDC090025 TaxID=3365922 RepID=UPI003836540A